MRVNNKSQHFLNHLDKWGKGDSALNLIPCLFRILRHKALQRLTPSSTLMSDILSVQHTLTIKQSTQNYMLFDQDEALLCFLIEKKISSIIDYFCIFLSIFLIESQQMLNNCENKLRKSISVQNDWKDFTDDFHLTSSK